MKKHLAIILSCSLIILLVGALFSFNYSKDVENAYAVELYVPTDTMENIYTEYYNYGYYDGANPIPGYYPISDLDDLNYFNNLVQTPADLKDCVFYLTSDLDLTGITHTPIGDGNYFEGVFDGCGYSIRNFSITETTRSIYGLFHGISEDGIIKNLNIDNANLTQRINGGVMGAIAGINDGLVEKCSVTNSTVASLRSGNIGAIVGENESGRINYSYAVSVNIDGLYASGISKYGYIDNCFTFDIQEAGTYSSSTYFYYVGGSDYITNSYYYSDCATPENFYNITESTVNDFSSGRICMLLNNSFNSSGSNVFGQEIGIDEYPVFLTPGNYSTKLTIPVHFETNGEIFATEVANENGFLQSLPTPYNKQKGTCTYSLNETPFTLSNVITDEITVNVSGGIAKTISTYFFEDASGTGSIEDPFLISTKEDLALFRLASDAQETISSGESYGVIGNKAHVVLANDIVLNPMESNGLGNVFVVEYEEDTYFFEPGSGFWYISTDLENKLIDPSLLSTLSSLVYPWNSFDDFYGSFDGNGFEIEGIYINDTGRYYSGFFSFLHGSVFDLSVSGYIKASSYAGGISGILRENGSIVNCINRATVQTTSDASGGIVGQLEEGTIDSCINYAGISSASAAGGISGRMYNYNNSTSTIINCINYGNVTSVGSYTGGIIGRADGRFSEIFNNINYGSIAASASSAGGILGYSSNYVSLEISNNMNFNTVNSPQYEGGIIGSYSSGTSFSHYNYWLTGCCDNEDGYGYKNVNTVWENNSNFSEIDGTLTVSSLIDVNGDGVDSTSLLSLANEFATMYPGCKSWEQTPNVTLIYSTSPYYTITYDPNYDSSYEDTIVYSPYQSTIYDPGFVRDGYRFLGWSTEQSETEADETYAPGELCFLEENITLYAIWENDYEVKYINSLGGIYQEYNQYISTNETEFNVLGLDDIEFWPLFEIYYFLGWNTDPEATDADPIYSDGYVTAPISGDLILHAIWGFNPSETLQGSGTESDPFLISSLYDLETLAIWTNYGYFLQGAHFKQTADIIMNNFILVGDVLYAVYEDGETIYYFDYYDFSFYSPSDLLTPVSLEPSVQEALLSLTYFWTPIGQEEFGNFQGNYDGNGYSIEGLIPDGEYSYSGLFGYTEYATISNLQIKYGIISIQEIGGAIAAHTQSTKIINCSVEDVHFYEASSGDLYGGGLVGILEDESSIINSYVVGTIVFEDSGGDNYFGGLVYSIAYDSSIINCYAHFTPIGPDSYSIHYAGIAIELDYYGEYDSTPMISNCYYFIGDPTSPFYFPSSFYDDPFYFEYNRIKDVFFFEIHFEEEFFPENPPESGFWVIELVGKSDIIFTDLAEALNSFSYSYEEASNWSLYNAPDKTPSLEYFLTLTFKDSTNNEATGLLISSSETISIEKRFETGDVYYTLDGSEPTMETGTQYTEPFIVQNGDILKAVEYYNGSYLVVSTIVFARALSLEYDTSSAISGSMPSDSKYYSVGDIINLDRGYDLVGPSETPVFSGWALSESSTEGTYSLVITAPAEGFVVTLYPVWKSILDSPSVWDGVTFDVDWYFNNPNAKVFNISTAAEFAGIPYLVDLIQITDFKNQTINLLADIDLGNHEWPSIGWNGTFSGNMNGNFHTIYNLCISPNNPWYDYVDYTGLFDNVYNGSVKNLGLSGGYVYGENCAASLVNYLDYSSISNCWVEGVEVEATEYGSIVGGIVASAYYSKITNCYSLANLRVGISGSAGGIVGDTYTNDESLFSNCYFAGSIEYEFIANAGSIFGRFQTENTSIVPVASSFYYPVNTFPLIGYSTLLPGSILSTSSFFYQNNELTLSNEVDPNMDSNPATSLLIALNEGAEVSFFPWENSLWYEDSFGMIRLNPIAFAEVTPNLWTDEDIVDLDWYYNNIGNNSFYISTPAELGGLAYIVNTLGEYFSGKTVYLLNDLDMSGAIWVPIGNNYNFSIYFSGLFDGMGHVLSNLNTPSSLFEYSSGFFGSVYHGTIQNLGIVDSSSFANATAGGIVGILEGNIYNCFYTGTVFGRTYSGGLVGEFQGSSEGGGIQNCWTTAEVSGLPGCIIGALVGRSSGWDDQTSYCYWVDNDYILPIGMEQDGGSYSDCQPLAYNDGQYNMLSYPVDYDEDFVESTTLVQALNEVVRMFGITEYAKHGLTLTGAPTFDGYYQSYDVIADFTHIWIGYGVAGRNVALEGYDYVIGIAASAGYTLNGALPSVYVGGVLLDSSGYSWDTSESILTIYAQYITDNITITYEALPALLSISKVATTNGSFEVNANALYRSTVEITVTPDAGYEVSTITCQELWRAPFTPTYNIITGKYEFVMPGTATTITVTFSAVEYTITLFDEDGDALHGVYETDLSVATINDTVEIITSPNSGYEVDSVTYTINSIERNVSFDEGYWITDITGDVIVKVTFKVKLYTVSKYTTDPVGGDFSISSSQAPAGANVYVSLSVDPGWTISNPAEDIYYSYGEKDYSLNQDTNYYYRKFTMPASDVTVNVIFSEVLYTITKNPTSNGSYIVVNGDDQEISTANYSEMVYVVPTPNTGYEVESVEYSTDIDSVNIQYDLGYSFSMPENNTSISVTFKKVVYDITANATTNGSYTLSKTSGYYGDTITVTPIPATGYGIDSVSYDDGASHDITPVSDVYSFDMPASDISISVSFYPLDYVITTNEPINGSYTVTDSNSDPVTSMSYGGEVNINPTPDYGYQVDKVYYYADSVGFVYIPNISGYTFDMPAFDIDVYVTFISTSANIHVNTPIGGWVKVTNDYSGVNIIDTAPPAATVYLTYYLNPGYSLDEVFSFTILNETPAEEDYTLASGSTYYFTMPLTGGVTISLNTVLGSKSISYYDTDGYATHGSYSALSETVNVGSLVEITATPADGYYISSISYNDGTDTVYLPSLEFVMPNSDVTLRVEFAPITYYVTKNSSNGTFVVNTTSTTVGATITIPQFDPNTGYELYSVSYNDGVDDYDVSPVLGVYSFNMPASDVTVTVVFTKINYALSKDETENGSFLITSDGIEEISLANYMDEVIIIVNPTTGYEIDYMYYEYLRGESTVTIYIAYNSGYKFTMPSHDTTVHVSFKKSNYLITKTPTEGGTIIVDDADLVSEYDAVITLTVTPLSGFKIDHVYYTNKATSIQTELYYVTTPGNYIFTMPDANVSVEATFSRVQYGITATTVGLGNYEMWDGNGLIESGLATFGYNTYVVLEDSFAPAAGYKFLSVEIIKDSDLSVISYTYTHDTELGLGKYQFLMPNSAITVTVTFVEGNYLVSFEALSNGNAKIYRDGQAEVTYLDDVKYNEQIAIKVYPNIGYEIASVTAFYDSAPNLLSDPESDGVYLLSMPAENVVLSVTFSAIDYTVTSEISGTGTLLLNGSVSLSDANVGDKITLTITPGDYYELSEISYTYGATTKTITPVEGVYSFNMPASDVEIAISFTKIIYTITYQSLEVTPPEAVTYDCETDLVLAAGISRPGYIFSGWKITTASGSWMINTIYGASDNLPTTMNGNVTLTAQWDAVLYELQINGQTITYSRDESITIPSAITAPFGYAFAGWEVFGLPTGNWVSGEIALADSVYPIGEKYGDASLRPKNTALSYVMTFDVQGGIYIEDLTYYSSVVQKLHGEASKTGYTFTGWKVTANDGNWVIGELYPANYQFEAVGIYGNVTLQAQWSIITYTINIYEDNDSANVLLDTLQYTIETGFTLSTGTPRNGYFLAHYEVTWSQANWASVYGEYEPGFFEAGNYGNANVKERWEKTLYTISFDTDGGSTIDPTNYYIGVIISIVANPEKEGFTLTGWKVTTPGGSWNLNYVYPTVISYPNNHEIYGDVTLTAVWEISEYSIDYSGAANTGVFLHNQTVSFATKASSPGHTFLYWEVISSDPESNWVIGERYNSGDSTSGKYGDVVLTEVWETPTISITYVTGNNASVLVPGTPSVVYGQSISALPLVSHTLRPGYSYNLIGWFDAEVDGNLITGETLINESNLAILSDARTTISLYSRFTESLNTYSIQYYNVGTSSNSNPASYTVESEKIDLVAISKIGYTFDGWYDNDTFTGSVILSIEASSTGNKMLYAKFNAIEYTIIYLSNGGTNINSELYTIEDALTLSIPPIRPGYSFEGWVSGATTEGNWESEHTFNGAEALNAGKYGNITLEAQWEKIIITLNDSTVSGDNITFNPDGTVSLPNPEKDGFTFDGWYLDAECTQFFNPETDTITSGMTLYPKWSIVGAGGTTPGLSGGAIAGIVVGSVGFVAIVLTLLYFFVLKKKGFDIKNLLQKKPKRIDNLTQQKPEEPKTTESDGDNTPKE